MSKWLTKEQLFKEMYPDEVSSHENSKDGHIYTSPAPADDFRKIMELGREHGRKRFLNQHMKNTVNESMDANKKVMMKGEQQGNKIMPSNEPLSETCQLFETVMNETERNLEKETKKLKMLKKRNRQLDAVITSAKYLKDYEI